MERKPILLAATICITLIVASTLGLFIVLDRLAPDTARVRAWLAGKASLAERPRPPRTPVMASVPRPSAPAVSEPANLVPEPATGSVPASSVASAPASSPVATGAPAALEPKRIRTIAISDPLASSVLSGAQKTPSDVDPVPVPQSGALSAAPPAGGAPFPPGTAVPLPTPRAATKASGR